MKNLSVRVDEDTFRTIKIKAVKQDLSLREYVLRLIMADLEKDKEKSDT